jgi:hypothetical protein
LEWPRIANYINYWELIGFFVNYMSAFVFLTIQLWGQMNFFPQKSPHKAGLEQVPGWHQARLQP